MLVKPRDIFTLALPVIQLIHPLPLRGSCVIRENYVHNLDSNPGIVI